MEHPATDHTLDATGLNCPLPIIKARKALADMPVGETLLVLATDPGSMTDFPAFCRMTGHQLSSAEQQGSVYRFVLTKTG